MYCENLELSHQWHAHDDACTVFPFCAFRKERKGKAGGLVERVYSLCAALLEK